MMRILVVSNLYPPHTLGGYEIQCAQIVEGLRQRGHTIRVLTGNYGIDAPRVEGEIHRLLAYCPQRGQLSAWNLFQQEREAAAIVRRVLDQFRPDAIYVWNMWTLPPSAVLALQDSGIRVVYQIAHNWLLEGYPHDSWLHRWQPSANRWKNAARRLLHSLVRRLGVATRRSDIRPRQVIFVSQYRRDEHIQAGLPVEQSYVVCGGLLPPREGPLRQRTPGAPWRLVYVARYLTRAKGVLTAVQAMRRLVEQGYHDVHLDIIGAFAPDQDDYRAEVEAVAQPLTDTVRFCGPLPHDDVIARYPEYDALLFCANYPEGLPLTVAEAMQTGLPVIGSPVGGAAEILLSEASLTFPPDDDAALAEQIKRLHDEPGLWERLSGGAVALVARQFSMDDALSRTEAILAGEQEPS
ncbi:MAG: glycosyltransferase family 4 protein [Chloroflexi bacterium]|nr:glycosyltransferase family 4 protein [Chloroflexota bacterium]